MPTAAIGAPVREPSLDNSQTMQHCSGAPGAAPSGALQAQLAPATCAICLEAQQVAAMHSLVGCGHRFCRDCLRSYALAALSARLVPIMCAYLAMPPMLPVISSTLRLNTIPSGFVPWVLCSAAHGGFARMRRCPDTECRKPVGASDWEALLPAPAAKELRQLQAETAIPAVRSSCAPASRKAGAGHHATDCAPSLLVSRSATSVPREPAMRGRCCAGAEAVLPSPRVFCTHRPPVWH